MSPPSPPPARSNRSRYRTTPIVTRFLTRHLWSAPDRTLADAATAQKEAYGRATVIVRVFYAASFLWTLQSISSWARFVDLDEAEPLWPIAWWFDSVGVATGSNIVFGALLVASVLVLALPDRRLARIAYAVALLQYMALVNVADKINHNLHSWLFVSIILILLPKGPWTPARNRADRQVYLTVISIAQTVVLLFYSLTGMWKVYFGLVDRAAGRLSGFSPDGFSYIVGQRILQTNSPTLLGDFFVDHAEIGWALFVGTMYLELFSVLIAFRPRLHRWWGIVLVLFHAGTYLVMGFSFPENVVLIGLLLVCSPMAPDKFDLKATVLDLPLLHFVAKRIREFRRSRAASPEPIPVTEAEPS